MLALCHHFLSFSQLFLLCQNVAWKLPAFSRNFVRTWSAHPSSCKTLSGLYQNFLSATALVRTLASLAGTLSTLASTQYLPLLTSSVSDRGNFFRIRIRVSIFVRLRIQTQTFELWSPDLPDPPHCLPRLVRTLPGLCQRFAGTLLTHREHLPSLASTLLAFCHHLSALFHDLPALCQHLTALSAL